MRIIAALTLSALLVPVRAAEPASAGYQWQLPKGFPVPLIPPDNPMTAAKVELGRHLFYDTRLSSNGQSSCATCHRQELAFTDGRPVSIGTTGEKHPRGSMSLVNVAYSAVLTWTDPAMRELEQQALVPMFGEHPIELGLHDREAFLSRLRSDHLYRRLFKNAFPGDNDPFTVGNVTKSLACFERTIISARSPWDRYHYDGDDTAISPSAKHGEVLFFSQPLSCFRCHGGFNFSDNTTSANRSLTELSFHNTGLDNVSSAKFKAPTLRNIALTAPYMHDGSIATLEGVLDHYAAGGRGHDNPLKDSLIAGFHLTAQDKTDLIAFLNALTDQDVLHDPRFSNSQPQN